MATKAKRPRDTNKLAKFVMDIATGQTTEKPLDEIKRKGGLIGGKARANALTPDQRARIASTAAQARWNKSKG